MKSNKILIFISKLNYQLTQNFYVGTPAAKIMMKNRDSIVKCKHLCPSGVSSIPEISW